MAEHVKKIKKKKDGTGPALLLLRPLFTRTVVTNKLMWKNALMGKIGLLSSTEASRGLIWTDWTISCFDLQCVSLYKVPTTYMPSK